jgi:hypothetical protein
MCLQFYYLNREIILFDNLKEVKKIENKKKI